MSEIIFISYRREDAAAEAGRLRDAIADAVGANAVFMDTESIQLGEPWPDRLKSAVQAAKYVIAVIGPDWLTAGTNQWGQRRIDDPEDWVRLELELALDDANKTVIPVLVKGGEMPPPDVLPDSIQSLTTCQALTLRHDAWARDVEHLLEKIQMPVMEPTDKDQPIDGLVTIIRQKVQADIKNRCGSMRVLDMEQPIGLGDIYTDVNILEKISGRQRQGVPELLEKYNCENFERFTLGNIKQKRVPGMAAVHQHAKLMILGKPGAGKTTFLKRLAMLCSSGRLQTEHVPIFITLKYFSDDEEKPKLLDYITQQWSECGIHDSDKPKAILSQGKALVLLDGLDEVRPEAHDRTLREIRHFSNQFDQCQFVMTCRIAAQEYTFEQFTEVEVADFDENQIAEFIHNWFQTKQDPDKAKIFIEKLNANKPIQELASNPLLLTLLCLVFGDGADFPRNRSELYKEGLDILLKKWDAKRNITRQQLYQQLSLLGKQHLLSQIAFHMFDNDEYFFKQKVIEQQITTYIENLPGASTEPKALKLDSEAVLKSIEAHHGLLVERARGIYSFSHLTFQEYFTAYKITHPTLKLSQNLQNLAQHITETRWREVFLLAVEMLQPADELLRLMKIRVDNLLAKDEKLQRFLVWVKEKSASTQSPYKLSTIRAFYCALALARDLDLDLALALARDLDLAFALTFARALARDLDRALDHALDRALDRALDLDLDLDPLLKQALQSLKAKLPSPKDDRNTSKQWWQTNGKAWIEDLRKVMIEHRNIGHDWQFSDEQKEILQHYYDANKLLIECLNSDGYVTRSVREEIEETLLLPLAEISPTRQ